MNKTLPVATIRTQVTVPLRFPGGYATTARVFTFNGLVDGREHLAFGLGDRARPLTPDSDEDVPLVRPHSECLTGDVFGSQRCDCGPQLREAVERIAAVGGYLLYLRQEGRGIGLANKIRAYALQDRGLDTVDANLALGLPVDRREYASAAEILRLLGLRQVRLLTNNPLKSAALERHGVQVVERVPIAVPPNSINKHYLRTKADRMGHLLAFERQA